MDYKLVLNIVLVFLWWFVFSWICYLTDAWIFRIPKAYNILWFQIPEQLIQQLSFYSCFPTILGTIADAHYSLLSILIWLIQVDLRVRAFLFSLPGLTWLKLFFYSQNFFSSTFEYSNFSKIIKYTTGKMTHIQ